MPKIGKNPLRRFAKDPEWLTQEVVQTLLDYDATSGFFRWKLDPAASVQWNARYAGALAGQTTVRGYVIIKVRGRQVGAHRLAWMYVHGRWPTNQIDHRNGVRNDNRIENLREATPSENLRNKAGNNNKTTPKGVCLKKSTGRWVASIQLEGKTSHLGTFSTPEAAHAAYEQAARQHYGDFARSA